MGDKPTHRLTIVSRDNTKHKTRAGVAWECNGFFNIRLNPGVVLRERDSDRYFFNLVSYDQDFVPRDAEAEQQDVASNSEDEDGPYF